MSLAKFDANIRPTYPTDASVSKLLWRCNGFSLEEVFLIMSRISFKSSMSRHTRFSGINYKGKLLNIS